MHCTILKEMRGREKVILLSGVVVCGSLIYSVGVGSSELNIVKKY